MKRTRTLLLAGTVISGAALFLHPAAVLAANDLVVAQAEQAPPPELTPEELKELEKKKKREQKQQQREERKQERQEQKQQKQEQKQQKQEQKQQDAAPPPAETPPPAEQKSAPSEAPPPPPPADTPPPPADAAPPPAETPPPAEQKSAPSEAAPDTGKQKQREERKQERQEQKQQKQEQKQQDGAPPVPPVEPPPASPQAPADTPPPPPSGAATDSPPAPAPEQQQSAPPAPTPAGEQPAIPPEELKGGAVTPEQKKRREERVDRDFKNRDKKLDARFDRKVEQRGDRTIIREGDNRIIIRDGGRVIIRNDETERFRRNARDVDVQRRNNGDTVTVIRRPNGVEIITVKDENGNLIRRVKRVNGREIVLIDNRRAWERGGRWDRNRGWRDRNRDGLYLDFYLDLPPVRVDIPRDEYIVHADEGSYEDYEEAFGAPPLVASERPYSLEEVTQNVRLRERVRSVDLNTVTFATAEWRVSDDQIPLLEDIARAMKAMIDRDPTQVYLVEGHTDAVGSNVDNLSLSDRRAEEVAAILTQYYQIPAENLVTQGYGEDYLKVNTLAANEENRRVTIRNITHLLNTQQSQAAPQ